jgi:outer membrane receptor protein involved in Fe transport
MKAHRFCEVLAAVLLTVAGVTRAEDTTEPTLDDLLETKVSGASKYDQIARRAPASVSIVTADDIERYGYRTIADVLGRVRGFYTSYDRNYTYVGVRGFSRPTDYNNRVLLLIDGHTTNESVFGSAQLGSELGLDITLVERVEIIRGPGSALYGTGAMLTVVNIILKRGSAIGGRRAAAGGGSFGKSNGLLMAGGQTDRGLDVAAGLFGTHVDGQNIFYPEYASDPSTKGTARGLDGEKSYGAALSAYYGKFHLSGLTTSREKAIPTGAFDTTFGAPGAQTTDKHQFLDLSWEDEIASDLSLRLRASTDSYGYRGQYPASPTSFEGAQDDWWGAEAELRWDPRPDNRFTAGAEYRRDTTAEYRNSDAAQTYFQGNFPFDTISLYAQDEFQITDNLAVIGGLRYDRYSTGHSAANPRGAIVFNATPSSTLKLLYGRAFRTPNIYETRYQDPTAGAKDNPNLKPEHIETLEVAWEQRLGPSLFGAVSAYQSRMTDLIDQVVDPADSLLQYQNQGTARTRGIELELTALLGGGVSAFANYSYARAIDVENNEPLTNSPEHVAKLGAAAPLTRWLRASGELLYESGRLTVQNTTTSGYLLANTTLLIEPPQVPLRLSLQIRNLFGTQYATPGGFEHRQAAISQDGRNFSARVECRF